ncbi:Conserved oligomeric Golgi complex subunit, putative [Perkinsus marinus ATCC 50983]|uniref:Conserved oligomeric Golgi complex subunit 4 n=1 Tax=Perkinsus marinus (strain ATCC 50983 / TXsc) TaxID=423536 RepID=C5LP43_PERM5|nr:Conserved oligomeric Golgi complex subunit, putative [Perkinsus marinus ATCC 50983]EER01494.1 Conserved oligomeric Golgi complex subunit, putative [Perkinsus marinus ATCC 50983]|eukprot:XP_002768776.1 Conserved oligomeric Golgi complex subunit, putative [Perkinsus marinus ATCC 50983]
MLRTNQRSVYDNVELQEKIIRLEAEVSELSQTACSLSSRVEELDNTKCALQEAQDLAQSVITMHDTIHICKEALATNNIDDAAKAIARIREIRRMYPDIYKVCDNASLKEAKRLEDEVCSLVRKAFDNAIISGDKDGVSKCGRLFYPLGMTTEAVARYVRFIRQTLAAQCKQKLSSVTATTTTSNDASSSSSSNVINEKYVNTLTDVFLAVADIIQDHQRNIEEQFGPINFIMVLRGLQSEVDIQAIAVIKRLRESRSITTIMEHFQTIADECIDNNDASSIVDEIDLGEKDAVIDEICIIAQRCNQFDHYIHNISRQVVAELGNDDKRRLMYGEVAPDEKDYNEDHHHHKSRNTYGEDGLPIMTDLTELVQELMGEYVLYERSFIIVSTIKAIHEDRIDMDDPQQMTSSVVDDVFFVLNKAIRRSLSSDDIDSACAVMNHIVQVLSNEYKTICLDKPLQESKRNFSSFLAHREYIMEAINDDSTAAAAGGGGLNNRTKGMMLIVVDVGIERVMARLH